MNKIHEITDDIKGHSSVLGELFAFLWARKLWWLVPLILVLILVGLALVFLQSSVAPFIYTII